MLCSVQLQCRLSSLLCGWCARAHVCACLCMCVCVCVYVCVCVRAHELDSACVLATVSVCGCVFLQQWVRHA
jgi:hypothetical protein